ncbi:conserved hypothetical protein [Shewanella sediminis HAW-EB3]|uniref:Lipoprotein n=1 Tax=Shewanella sediminis (strain HAW-EB3) TaxID=425104 RepID=A8FW26_SHESH|nr:hypothetical protein [Shewanella sediminis]ABV37049.1 conserved hypothetical protein [Shewanella sediminis HAW-EB3]
MNTLKTVMLVSTLSLIACGSSDDGEPMPTFPRCELQSQLTSIETGSDLEFLVEEDYQVNQSAAIIARINNQDSDGLHFSWQQLTGPALILKSIKSQVLAFQATKPGSYTFSVTVSGDELLLEKNIELTIQEGPVSRLNVRSDHQVVEGNNVSFRVDRVDGQIPSDLSWCIAAGPDLNLDTSNIETPQFIAPEVNTDTISQLRATATIGGVQTSSDVIALITHEQVITSEYFDKPIARTHPYKSDTPYAGNLQSCVYSNQLTAPCSIEQLPLIGHTQALPDKNKILDRLLVSHQWMGENFEAFLNEMDPATDFSKLLQSVTAVVISYDIRPSFYWALTGAIYLDPNDLWLLAQERDVINEAADYRSLFGNELNFIMPWRYVKDNQYVSYSVPRETRTHRTMAELSPELSSLLYHELAHANDFFPRSVHDSIEGGTLLDHYNRRSLAGELVSDKVTAQYPLYSDELTSLANVSFRGQAATAIQKAYLPADITQFFSTDRATGYYAYSTKREDTAMLFEEAMMSHRYRILRDVGITDKPDSPTASNILVDWGQRGRIGEDTIQARAALVINEILPELDGNTLVGALPDPIQMTQGLSWLDNLTISPVLSISSDSEHLSKQAPISNHTQRVIPELRVSGDRHKIDN